jgi:tRNA U34 5-methylaminomethyl-2-thiouridine-forming methyltransferase MnmC
MNEQYHSVNGAITESEYVYIERGFKFSTKQNPNVFEVGLGTGLNCLLTALETIKEGKSTFYYSIEKYPLPSEITQQLNYGTIISEEAQHIFEKIHQCPWEEVVEITSGFKLFKSKIDLETYDFNNKEKYDIIYYDAFGPDKQPGMWTPEIFKKIHSLAAENAIFVTYSAKGEVRRQLSHVGFEMERLPGPPGKKEMLRGIKRKSKN